MRKTNNLLSNSELSAHDLCGLAANLLINRGWMLATAESCTGGLIAATCTDLAGSSAWFERGFVTYSNAAKIELLGVDAGLIAHHGAVSEAVVLSLIHISHPHARPGSSNGIERTSNTAHQYGHCLLYTSRCV